MKKFAFVIAMILAIAVCFAGCEITNPEVMENFSQTNTEFTAALNSFVDRAGLLMDINETPESISESFDEDIALYKDTEVLETLYYLHLVTYDYESQNERDIMVTKLNDENYSIIDSLETQKTISIKTSLRSSSMTVEENGIIQVILEKSVIVADSDEDQDDDSELSNKFCLQFTQNNFDGTYDILQIVIFGEDEGKVAVFEGQSLLFSSIYKVDTDNNFATGGLRNYQIDEDSFIYDINE